MRDNQFTIRTLLIGTVLVALVVRFPKSTIASGLALASFIVCMSLIGAIRDAFQTTDAWFPLTWRCLSSLS